LFNKTGSSEIVSDEFRNLELISPSLFFMNIFRSSYAGDEEITFPFLSLYNFDYPPIKTSLFNSRSSAVRRAGGYLGLSNLGSTCYMNSLIQQLYMHIPFRYAVLLYEKEKNTDSLKNESLKESVTFLDRSTLVKNIKLTLTQVASNEKTYSQLRLVFALLQESILPFVDMKFFGSSYTNASGTTSIDLHQQMDVEEFLNGLFEKLDYHLKVSKFPNIVRIFFGGSFTHQVVCANGYASSVGKIFFLGIFPREMKYFLLFLLI
jgi:uncharacterized UBP type Zn finger protein